METIMGKADASYNDMAALAGALGEHSQRVERASANAQQRQRLEEELQHEKALSRSMETERAHDIDELTRSVNEKDALLEENKAELADMHTRLEELKRVNDDLSERVQSQTSAPETGALTAGSSGPPSSAPQSARILRSRKRKRTAGQPVDESGFEWNRLMNELRPLVNDLRPLNIAALETTQAQIFSAVMVTLAAPSARWNLSRFFWEQRRHVWYCFSQLAAHGPHFCGAMVREPQDGGLSECPAHPDAQCLQVRVAAESELRTGGGKVVWRGN